MRIITLFGALLAALALVFYLVGIAGAATQPLTLIAVLLVAIGALTGN